MTLQELFDKLSDAQKKYPNLKDYPIRFAMVAGDNHVMLKLTYLGVSTDNEVIFGFPPLTKIIREAYLESVNDIFDKINESAKEKVLQGYCEMDDEDEYVAS